MDGHPVGEVLADGRSEYEFQNSIFYRWFNAPSSTDSFCNSRLVQRDDSLAYRSQVYGDFKPEEKTRLFVTAGDSMGRQQTRTLTAVVGENEGFQDGDSPAVNDAR
jgi:hypothetical protein